MSNTPAEPLQCVALRKDGQRCRAFASTPDGVCMMHGPRAGEVQRRGGAARSNANRAAKLLPSRLVPIVEGLERVFAAVEKENFDTRKAVAMATVARALIAAFDAGEYEARIRLLEQQAADAGLYRDRYGHVKGAPTQWPTRPA
jgi:hypothetical protein